MFGVIGWIERKQGSGSMRMQVFITLLLSLFTASGGGIGNYYVLYENFNYEPVTAVSSNTGAYLFDFLPVDFDNLDTNMKLSVSASVFVKQAGNYYGKDVKNGESTDPLKHISILWNHKKEFMPFLSYYTPYKAVLIRGEQEELIRKRDAVSLGIISDLEGHQIGMSVDGLISSYTVNQLNPSSERVYTSGGFSARMLMNKKVNKRSSMFMSAVSPVFWQYETGDHPVLPENRYFDMFQSSAGFNYRSGNYYAAYSFVYKNFDKIHDRDDGRQLTYPWVSEHNFIIGYKIDSHIRISADYQLLPSVFTKNMPVIGDVYRHTLGAFAGIDLGKITINFRYADSKMLSPSSVGRIYFQTDLIYYHK